MASFPSRPIISGIRTSPPPGSIQIPQPSSASLAAPPRSIRIEDRLAAQRAPVSALKSPGDQLNRPRAIADGYCGSFDRVAVEGKLVHGATGLDIGHELRVKLVGVNVEAGFIDFVRVGGAGSNG